MAKLTPVVLDFETYWSATHSLSKMNPVVYAMHPDTEIQSCSITMPNRPTVVVFGEDQIRAVFARMPWDKLMAVAHNMSGFDAMLLAWRFGITPAMWGCTLAMARPIYAKVCGLSLDALLKHLGAPMTKGSLEATNTKGKRLEEFSEDELAAIKEYNKVDGDACMWLFKRLAKETSVRELRVIDMTIRMLVDAKLQIDSDLLEHTLEMVKEEKRQSLLNVADLLDVAWENEAERLEEVRAKLASAPKFSKILEAYGFEVPMKPSKTALAKGEHRLIPALSKTDEDMQALVEDDNPVISACAQARLGVKSTQLESRIETFIEWAKHTGGGAPMPLHYCGADTTGRWSGAMKANVQNLPAVGRGKNRHADSLRNSLLAPKGHKVVVADLSGIELRVNHFLWKVEESMSLYQNDAEADLYRAFAAVRYAVTPDEVTKAQRQLAKVAQLGLGFGAGHATFKTVAKVMGGLVIDDQESMEIVSDWRSQYRRIAEGWRTCHEALRYIYAGKEVEIDPWGLTHTSEAGIRLPSGRVIRYPSLHEEPRDNGRGKEWWYGQGRHRARIYAGKIDENIVQALARDVMADNMLKFTRDTGVYPSLTVHDEAVYVVPEQEAEGMLAHLQEIMRTPPKWWPELVVWSEGSVADSYGAAK